MRQRNGSILANPVLIGATNEVGYAAGPTYRYYDQSGGHGLGPSHVPAGETSTREPGGLGAPLDPANLGSP